MEDALEQASWQDSETLDFTPPPKGRHRYAEEQQKLEDIYAFLGSMEWRTCTTNKPHGTTRPEILILYEHVGFNKDQTRQRQEETFEEE